MNGGRMRGDLEFLTSPPIEGRASLSSGAAATAWFLAAEMRKIGLEPVADGGFLQPFDLVPVRLLLVILDGWFKVWLKGVT